MTRPILPEYRDVSRLVSCIDSPLITQLEKYVYYNEPIKNADVFRNDLQELIDEIYEMGFNDGVFTINRI